MCACFSPLASRALAGGSLAMDASSTRQAHEFAHVMEQLRRGREDCVGIQGSRCWHGRKRGAAMLGQAAAIQRGGEGDGCCCTHTICCRQGRAAVAPPAESPTPRPVRLLLRQAPRDPTTTSVTHACALTESGWASPRYATGQVCKWR
jgi:hypothetical protein